MAGGTTRHLLARHPYAPISKLDGRRMQQVNRALVLHLVRTDTPQSRIDLVRRTGLSPATITDIVDHLLHEGLIRDEGTAATGTLGRRPSRLAFNPDARLALGIEIDVHDVRVGLVNLGGMAHAVRSAPVTPGVGPDAVLDLAAHLARDVVRVAGAAVLGVGMAVPGLMQWPEGLNLFSPSFGWHDVPIRTLMEDRLGQPVVVDNDIRAAALAEHYFGAAQQTHSAVVLDVSYGVGGAVIIGGRLYRGAHGTAGEIGHNMVKPDGPRCGCGKQGCLAAFASGSGLLASSRDAVAHGRPSSLAGLTGDQLTIERFMAAAHAGDALAGELLSQAVTYLGWTVANIVDNWDPEVVVLGGSVIRAGGSLFEDLVAVAQRVVLETARTRVQIRRAALGPEAEVIGAATLVMADYLAPPL